MLASQGVHGVATVGLAGVLFLGAAFSTPRDNRGTKYRVTTEVTPTRVAPGDKVKIQARVFSHPSDTSETELIGQHYTSTVACPNGEIQRLFGQTGTPRVVRVPGLLPSGEAIVNVEITHGAAKGQTDRARFRIFGILRGARRTNTATPPAAAALR